jgi:hypothetical protein
MVGMTTKLEKRLRRTAHEKGWMASPSPGAMGVPFGPKGRATADEPVDLTFTCRTPDCSTCDTSGDFPRDAPGYDLDRDLLFAIEDELKVLGWDVEYLTGYEAKIGRRDPATDKDTSFGIVWMSWRKVDGVTVYGVGEDRDPHDILVLRGPADDPKVVAAAADQFMHSLWHQGQDEYISRLGAQNAKLSVLTSRLGRLARFPLVTSGQILAALAEAKKTSR